MLGLLARAAKWLAISLIVLGSLARPARTASYQSFNISTFSAPGAVLAAGACGTGAGSGRLSTALGITCACKGWAAGEAAPRVMPTSTGRSTMPVVELALVAMCGIIVMSLIYTDWTLMRDLST